MKGAGVGRDWGRNDGNTILMHEILKKIFKKFLKAKDTETDQNVPERLQGQWEQS